MASTFTANLNLEKPAVGEQNNTWGTTANSNYDLIDTWINGYLSKSVAGSSNVTLSASEYAHKTLILTGTLTGSIDLIFPAIEGFWHIYNNTSGAFTITIKVSGQSGDTLDQGDWGLFYNTATDMAKVTWGTSAGGTGGTSVSAAKTSFDVPFHAVDNETTGTKTMVAADIGKLVECDTSGGAITYDLLAVATAGAGATVGVINTDGTAAVTIDPNGAETVNGAATLALTDAQDCAILVCDGTEWWALRGSIPASTFMKTVLDDANAAAARTTLAAATTSQTSGFSGMLLEPDDQDYKIVVKASIGGTITETTTICASGTCTATFKINTTALGGTANSVSSSEQSQAHASANVFSAGDDIVITISSNSSCIDKSWTIKFTETLS